MPTRLVEGFRVLREGGRIDNRSYDASKKSHAFLLCF